MASSDSWEPLEWVREVEERSVFNEELNNARDELERKMYRTWRREEQRWRLISTRRNYAPDE